jgi:hypothetical protein
VTTTLVLTEPLAASLLEASQRDVESAGVLLARPVPTTRGDLRLLGVKIEWVPESGYAERSRDRLSIRSTGYVPALAEAEAMQAVPIWLHTHPGDGASASPSGRDREVDRQLQEPFRLRSGSSMYGSIVIASEANRLRFTGHLESNGGDAQLDRIWTVGARMTLIPSAARPVEEIPVGFDRNIRAFGGEVQRVLQDLQVAVVGCGGTGSAVAEQLIRLGVRRLLVANCGWSDERHPATRKEQDVASFKTAIFIAQITDTAIRADLVRKDPAVQKAAHRAWIDILQAGKSVGDLGGEARTAWQRTGRAGGARFPARA